MIVMDANAAVAIALGAADGEALEMLRLPDERIAAPQLMHAEVAHTLAKYVRGGYLDASEAVACGQDAIALVDEFCEDASLWVEALTESARLGLSSYDLFYLALARRLGATLFTIDKRLQALCAENGVNSIWLDNDF